MPLPTHPALEHEPVSNLRTRKKEKTRLAIQDAALALFAEQGFDATTVEEIAARAEVSTATFFRYFPTKGEVIFGDEGYLLPILEQAIAGRPPSEHDLVAVRRAVLEIWVPQLDPQRVLRQTRAAATSPLLRGLSSDLGVAWQSVISRGLASRRGLDTPDRKCRLTGALVLAVFSAAVNAWIEDDARLGLDEAVDRAFNVLSELIGDWSD